MLAGDEALGVEIFDRLLHHCHVVQSDGTSYRLRQIEQQLKLQTAGTRSAAAGRLAVCGLASASAGQSVGKACKVRESSCPLTAGKFVFLDSCRQGLSPPKDRTTTPRLHLWPDARHL
jgi:IstB-like ATP binding protein